MVDTWRLTPYHLLWCVLGDTTMGNGSGSYIRKKLYVEVVTDYYPDAHGAAGGVGSVS